MDVPLGRDDFQQLASDDGRFLEPDPWRSRARSVGKLAHSDLNISASVMCPSGPTMRPALSVGVNRRARYLRFRLRNAAAACLSASGGSVVQARHSVYVRMLCFGR